MPWYVPATDLDFTTGEVVTAAKLDKISADLADLDRRTTPLGAEVLTSETTTSATYADLATAGPAVTVTVGASGLCLVSLYAKASNTLGSESFMGFAVSGATTVAAADAYAASNATSVPCAIAAVFLVSGLTAGSNTFTAQYKRGASGTTTFVNRKILAVPLGS